MGIRHEVSDPNTETVRFSQFLGEKESVFVLRRKSLISQSHTSGKPKNLSNTTLPWWTGIEMQSLVEM